jgi:N-acetyltransferase 10
MKGLCAEARGVKCAPGWLNAFYADFRKRFVNLLGFQFRAFSPALCLDILEGSSQKWGEAAEKGQSRNQVSAYDLKRMESYANNMVDYHMIMDLVPGMAREYFLSPNRAFSLSPVQAAILLALGLQFRLIEALEKEIKLPVSQLLAMFIKAIRKFSQAYRNVAITEIEAAENDAGEDAAAVGQKRAIEDLGAWEPTEKPLEADLDEAADDATKRLKLKQRELINSLDLDQYKIAGNEEDWTKEISKKKNNLSGSVLNIAASEDKKKSEKGTKSAAKELFSEAHKLAKKPKKTLKR